MILVGGYYGADGICSGGNTGDNVQVMSFAIARFPEMRNGGTYGCRKIAGTNSWSVHSEGRAGDLMTGTGQPTRNSKWLAEQLRVFSAELGIQGLIHNRRDWFSNRGTAWTEYHGVNPHVDHIHYEVRPGDNTSLTEIRKVLIGPSINGSHLFAGRVARPGDNGAHVRYVQTRLRDHGWSIDVDGDYGKLTTAAVTQFQILAGLDDDGVAGAVTQGRMR